MRPPFPPPGQGSQNKTNTTPQLRIFAPNNTTIEEDVARPKPSDERLHPTRLEGFLRLSPKNQRGPRLTGTPLKIFRALVNRADDLPWLRSQEPEMCKLFVTRVVRASSLSVYPKLQATTGLLKLCLQVSGRIFFWAQNQTPKVQRRMHACIKRSAHANPA